MKPFVLAKNQDLCSLRRLAAFFAIMVFLESEERHDRLLCHCQLSMHQDANDNVRFAHSFGVRGNSDCCQGASRKTQEKCTWLIL